MNVNFDMDVVADQIDLVGRGIMGISVACARCHDHKFDPIPTRDYYALAGIFTVLKRCGELPPTRDSQRQRPIYTSSRRPRKLHHPMTLLRLFWSCSRTPEFLNRFPNRNGLSEHHWRWVFVTIKQPADCKLNIKGEADKTGDAVPRGFLTACRFGAADIPMMNSRQSGRLELARWLTHRDHPLTARVMMNRIWLHLFGEGIVRTPNDFGVYGERPTHPELLDHLAIRFIDEGWSIRRMIRNIVLSRTYRLGSTADEALRAADPEMPC
jgi:hypothetical protein